MGYRGGCIVVFVVVGFDKAVAVVAQGFFGFLVGHEVGGGTVPAFSPVEGVVAATYGYQIADVDRAAEEFKAVIGTFVGLAVLYGGAIAYTVESDTVGFVLTVEGIAAVFHTHVFQRARIVGIVVAAINGTADFGTSFTSFGIGVCLAADVDTAPGTRFFLFAGHDDRSVGGTDGIDFTALFHEDVVHDVVVDGDNFHTGFDVQCGTVLYDVFAAQFVGAAGGQRYVGGNGTFQGRAVFDFIAVSIVAVAAIVVVVIAAAGGEDRHSGYQSQRVGFPFRCFHNSIVF